MRRADRLIKIVHFLRHRRRAVTARYIADEFDICVRTVYRDVQDLVDSGVPIRGEAGVGYIIDKNYYLPPIAFDADEIEAISLGINMVRQWTDDNFAKKANSAFEKVLAALPVQMQGELQQITTYSMSSGLGVPWKISFSGLRESIRSKKKIKISYKDEKSKKTDRLVRPLALIFFSPVWLLVGWCEKRNDFRNFRLDRIKELQYSNDIFEDEKDKDIAAYWEKESACYKKLS